MPSYIDRKVNQVQSIIKFFEDPCQAPWTVYFELALEPAGHVVIELLSFGLDDVIRGYFRPKGIYRRGRTGILARKFGKWAGIPEIGEMIGSHLPGAETMRGRTVSQGVRFLWIVDGVLQRIMFWWMIADLLTDFLYEWTSAINKTEYCQSRCTGSVLCPVLPNSIVPGQWITIHADLAHCEKSWGTASIEQGTGPLFSTGGWTACSVNVSQFIGACGGITLRITDGDDNIYDQIDCHENPDGTFTGVTAGSIPPGKFTFVQARVGGAWPPCGAVLITGGWMSGWGY